MRERFVEGLASGAERVHVVYNGMDIAKLPPAAGPKEKTVFFAGRLVRDKGVLELIEACAIALPQLEGWRLKVAGGDKLGIFAGKVPEVAGALAALGGRCEPLGLLGHADIMRQFARAEISVVPTITEEPLGRTAQEAMACGSALIASGSGGMGETIGGAGVIVRPVTPEALAAAVLALAKDEPRRRALQAAGTARMAAQFDIRAKAAELDELRAEVLARRAG